MCGAFFFKVSELKTGWLELGGSSHDSVQKLFAALSSTRSFGALNLEGCAVKKL